MLMPRTAILRPTVPILLPGQRLSDILGVASARREPSQSRISTRCERIFDMDANSTNLLYSVLGSVVLIIVVAIVGGFLHSRRERLLTHAERMKALELGREMPDD